MNLPMREELIEALKEVHKYDWVVSVCCPICRAVEVHTKGIFVQPDVEFFLGLAQKYGVTLWIGIDDEELLARFNK